MLMAILRGRECEISFTVRECDHIMCLAMTIIVLQRTLRLLQWSIVTITLGTYKAKVPNIMHDHCDLLCDKINN